jgi:hypothetical protein
VRFFACADNVFVVENYDSARAELPEGTPSGSVLKVRVRCNDHTFATCNSRNVAHTSHRAQALGQKWKALTDAERKVSCRSFCVPSRHTIAHHPPRVLVLTARTSAQHPPRVVLASRLAVQHALRVLVLALHSGRTIRSVC